MTMNQITAGAGADADVNENFRAVVPASLYGIKTWPGLNLTLYGGAFNGVDVADQTIALTASSTNYVVAHRTTGVVTAATGTSNWNDTAVYMRLYHIVAGGSTMTIAANSDQRQCYGGTGGGASDALDVSYDNTASGLTATNVQDAIDELDATGGSGFPALVTEAGSSRSVSTSDAGKYLRFTGTGAKTATFDSTAGFSTNQEFHVTNRAASGDVTLTAAGSMVLNAPKGGSLVLEPGDTVTVKMVASAAADVMGSTA